MDELTQAIDKTKQEMADAINKSGLPVGIVEMILADFQHQIQIMKLNIKEQEVQDATERVQQDDMD